MDYTLQEGRSMNTVRTVRAGFSLIEILIAIAIIAIMGAVVVPGFLGYRKRAQVRAAESTLRVLKQSIIAYESDTNQLPTSLRDLIKKPADERMGRKWQGPYLERKEVPLDPWNEKYQYKVTPGGENPYELYSYGPGGRGTPRTEWISVWDE